MLKFTESYKNNILFSRFIKLFSIDALVKISGFILLPVYLWLMSQADFGLFSYVTSIIITLGTILNFGFYAGQSKYYHNYNTPKEKLSVVYSINLTLFILIFIILAPVYIFNFDTFIIKLLFKNPINYNLFRFPILLALIFSVAAAMYNNYLLTSENINKMQRLNLWRLVSVNILSICCLYFFNFDKAFIRFSASYFIEIIIITTCVVPYIFRIKVPFNWHIVKKTFFLGLPLLFNALIGILVNFGDKYFLEKYGTFKELSVYFLAFSFASILSFIYASFQNIYMPVFLKETNIETNIRQSKKIARIFILAFIALSILIILGLKFLLLFNVIPSKYSNVIPLLPIVLTTQIIISLTSFVGIFIVYFEKTLLITLVGIFVGIICILLNILLIPKYKQYGAATAALIVNALYLIFYIMIVKAQIKKNEAVII